ncbi:MAG: hypothetical protein AUJ54_01120 [Ignavibacteria bacterium CG1_02_37_35]|nr:MAG: hypothetical protein AUJ54_01120 [Ignavibacteria bacterium CG1_02_37_35]PIX93711.1 MAG: hypothetical protein COZ25_09315 [Ignavibacteria bacterium CG_4_10_14_3_um_filter_37_18]
MKKYFIFLLVPFLFLSCSKDNNTIVDSTKSPGKISLKFDKANAPSSVVFINASLKRDGYTNIHGNLNIKTDSSAELLLNDIPEGTWHLLIEAQDSLGKIIYAGETDVTIVSNFITQVNLTLLPTTTGVGSIYIYITWGQSIPTTGWIDFIKNPIFLKKQSPLGPNDIALPKILYENGLYKMYYQNVFSSAKALIGYAESIDGYNWNSPYQSSVSPKDSNLYSWDSYTRGIGPVIKDRDQYFLYYYGFHNQYDYWQIGLATSSDGNHFTKKLNPVIKATDTERLTVAGDILKVNNIFYLYYTYGDASTGEFIKGISLAVSSDGVNWERYAQNPVLTPTQNWEGKGIGHPSVIYDGGEFRMVYMDAVGSGFGVATSKDGKSWAKSNHNPVFTGKNTSQQWSYGVYYPFVRKIDNKYKLFYTGSNYLGELCIGIAEKNEW